MNCLETHRWLDAEVDGELDLAHHLELEEHLKGCPQCAALRDHLAARRAVLRESLPRFAAPPALARSVRAAVLAETKPFAGMELRSRRVLLRWPVWSAAGIAALAVFALGLGFAWGNARARGSLLIDEAVTEHIRSLQFNHLSDVASTDQHTVKPWFAGKLDFAPPVVDLAAAGFPLSGGRLEHLAGRPAAALVFHRRSHAINLFIWPAAAGAVSSRQALLNGYHTQSWSRQGFNFLAVSEIPAAELSLFAAAFQSANPG